MIPDEDVRWLTREMNRWWGLKAQAESRSPEPQSSSRGPTKRSRCTKRVRSTPNVQKINCSVYWRESGPEPSFSMMAWLWYPSRATRSEIVRIGRQIRRPRGPKARRLLMETFVGREENERSHVGATQREKESGRSGRGRRGEEREREREGWAALGERTVVDFPSEVEEEDERNRFWLDRRGTNKKGMRSRFVGNSFLLFEPVFSLYAELLPVPHHRHCFLLRSTRASKQRWDLSMDLKR